MCLKNIHFCSMYTIRFVVRKAMVAMTITACCIVKNEAANMSEWLANTSAFADEIIVVDTGSTDGSSEFLLQKNIILEKYIWQNDFAAAKNFALEKATGEWIVFLDADERFREPQNIRKYVAALNKDRIEAVSVPLFNIDRDNNNALIGTNNVVRIFRNASYLRYMGAVHEQLMDIREPNRKINTIQADASLALEHTGYSSSIIQAKLRRNIQLIEREISIHHNIERYYKDLASCYFGLGEYEAALHYALLAVQSPYQPLGQQGDIYWIALEAMEILSYSLEDKLAVTEAALEAAGELPDFWGYKGYFYYHKQDYVNGKKFLAKAFAIAEQTETANICMGGSHFVQMKNQFKTAWADCCCQLHDTVQARKYYAEVLQANKWFVEALTGYLDTFADINSDEAKALLEFIYKKDIPEWEQLQKILLVNGYKKIERSEEQLLQDMAFNVQYLFVSLLGRKIDFSSYMMRNQLGLLPAETKELVLQYHGIADDMQVKYSAFSAVLKAVIVCGSEEMLHNYLRLTDSFTGKELKALADILVSEEKYLEALQLLEKIGADSAEADSSFWFTCGKIFYNLQDFVSARTCLERVDTDGVNSGELASYIAWSEEAAAR